MGAGADLWVPLANLTAQGGGRLEALRPMQGHSLSRAAYLKRLYCRRPPVERSTRGYCWGPASEAHEGADRLHMRRSGEQVGYHEANQSQACSGQ